MFLPQQQRPMVFYYSIELNRGGRASKSLGIERVRACGFPQSSGIERARASVGRVHSSSSKYLASNLKKIVAFLKKLTDLL